MTTSEHISVCINPGSVLMAFDYEWRCWVIFCLWAHLPCKQSDCLPASPHLDPTSPTVQLNHGSQKQTGAWVTVLRSQSSRIHHRRRFDFSCRPRLIVLQLQKRIIFKWDRCSRTKSSVTAWKVSLHCPSLKVALFALIECWHQRCTTFSVRCTKTLKCLRYHWAFKEVM